MSSVGQPKELLGALHLVRSGSTLAMREFDWQVRSVIQIGGIIATRFCITEFQPIGRRLLGNQLNLRNDCFSRLTGKFVVRFNLCPKGQSA